MMYIVDIHFSPVSSTRKYSNIYLGYGEEQIVPSSSEDGWRISDLLSVMCTVRFLLCLVLFFSHRSQKEYWKVINYSECICDCLTVTFSGSKADVLSFHNLCADGYNEILISRVLYGVFCSS